MRPITFDGDAFEQLVSWAVEDKKIHARIIRLIKDIDRSPHTGLGKPEPLRHDFAGYWSRRITDEHRLVYKVSEEGILIAACKFHYD